MPENSSAPTLKPSVPMTVNQIHVLKTFIHLSTSVLGGEACRLRHAAIRICEYLNKQNVSISIQTVYASLDSLVKIGFLAISSKLRLPKERTDSKSYDLNRSFYDNHDYHKVESWEWQALLKQRRGEKKEKATPLEQLLRPAKKKLTELEKQVEDLRKKTNKPQEKILQKKRQMAEIKKAMQKLKESATALKEVI
ncbi:MAG TPA: hypothetical protein DCX32_02215 [Candidatus Moranbacteria bacterium]|nr:MAG: hypothetical protein UW87_C0002G0046 [Candidatus Moranbacteria bacterium GW2011_GWC2_45_10]KKT95215.1 MAG: hypothetical protein UW95_C0003G0057 [Parcubacteria group bacterium GW2011_GWC1_45_14]HAV11335.1 hypothetical protein [Candidatus Moranbacteria bacterium]